MSKRSTDKFFEGQMPAKITFDDDSFDLTTVEFDKSGRFSTDSLLATTQRRFRASTLDEAGILREFSCEVQNISNGRVIGIWKEIDQ